MIVNAAIFTCSICGEASVNICSYCTKDACSNHRCERCKRCSDCCECEFPLSAEDPVAVDAAPELTLEPGLESTMLESTMLESTMLQSTTLESTVFESPELESPELQSTEPQAEASMPGFLTIEESSVFAEERAP